MVNLCFKRSIMLCALFVAMFTLLGAGTAYSQDSGKRRITGTVVDANGDPLVGATVQILNTSVGTITNVDGLYVIDVSDNDVLTFSYIGFLSQNLPVKGKDVLNVTLSEDSQMMEDVVVIGYGKEKRAAMVSSVSTINSRQLASPSSNITNNLAGQLAGLISIQRSAEPGRDDAEFWIRGISTFQGGTNPLVLVDGIPREISNIDPDEIETFTVLKDAAATAVYGAEGANGVILVTTKRGTVSKPQISFRAEYSIASPQRVPDFVDSWEYLELANEAQFNDGYDPYKYPDEIELYRSGADPDLYPNTNWMDELLDRTVNNQRYTLNFRGGAENAKYFVSMTYLRQEDVFKENKNALYDTNWGYQRYNLRSNIDLRVSKTTNLSVNLAGQYIDKTTANRSADDIFAFMLHTPSHMFPAVYSDGTLATYPVQSDGNNRNPYNMLYNQGYRKENSTKIQANVSLDQDLKFITPGLSINAKLGFDYDNNLSTLRDYWPSLYYATGRDTEGNLLFSTAVSGSPELKEPTFTSNGANAYRKIYIEGSVNYVKTIGQHDIKAMALYNMKENQKHSVVLPYRKQSFVGRASYGYDNRYFIEASFGLTGSEAFAAGNRWGIFPAVGLSYYVSNERFYPEALKKVMNGAKIRASIGRTGNDQVNGDARFLYRATFEESGYNFQQGYGTGATNGIGAGIYDLQFANPNIHWEIEHKRNVGLDLAFFDNSIELTADYFNDLRTDILLQRNTIPSTAGFHERPWENYGKVRNWGIDGSLNAKHQFGDVFVSARGTFTFARNKILEYDELPQEYAYQEVTGTRIGDRFVYIAERLYTEDDFIATQNSNGTYRYELKPGLPTVALGGILGPGDIKYADVNNDGIIDNYDKVRGVGHPYNPEINYGFGFNVEYKGFYVSTFFQGTANTTILLSEGNNTFWPFNWGIEKSNYRVDFLDRWTAENPSNDVLMPRLHVGYGNNVNKEPSTWWLKDGSFLRFKNLEFGYNVPKKFLQKIRLNTGRIYVMGQNLCVWDSFKLWDPEMGNRNKGNSYPMSRTFTIGLELSF